MSLEREMFLAGLRARMNARTTLSEKFCVLALAPARLLTFTRSFTQ
jgi:hypothetical protein